jgi:lipid-A-disaccharide synthase
MSASPLDLFIVVGEHSGDQLGFKLMRALRQLVPEAVSFRGVGGERMEEEGLESLFPLADIAVMGIVPVLMRLPQVLRRIEETVRAIRADPPTALILIDSPDFTHRVARRVRRDFPQLPVIDYVSPSVWAWRPGRARRMSAYVDEVLALLPFEPAAHARLGGPPCTYVGHPLIERLAELRPGPDETRRREEAPPVLVVLPGSRRAEVSRLMKPFGQAVARLVAEFGAPVEVVLPAVSHLADDIRRASASWPVKPTLVAGEAAKLAAFRTARAALAASGTVTLELALAQVPTVVAYRVSKLEEQLKHVITVPSIVLPNLVLGEPAIPEYLQHWGTPGALAGALLPLLRDSPERREQLAAMARLDALMEPGGESPSLRAARAILERLGRSPDRAGEVSAD